jgi:hypothetical protein
MSLGISHAERPRHEIVRAFANEGLPLDQRLAEMLDEHFSHQTERRGYGYTQATRYLAVLLNRPRDLLSTDDLDLFESWPQGEPLINSPREEHVHFSLGPRNITHNR